MFSFMTSVYHTEVVGGLSTRSAMLWVYAADQLKPIYSERYFPLSLEGRYHTIYGNHKTILKLIFND